MQAFIAASSSQPRKQTNVVSPLKNISKPLPVHVLSHSQASLDPEEQSRGRVVAQVLTPKQFGIAAVQAHPYYVDAIALAEALTS